MRSVYSAAREPRDRSGDRADGLFVSVSGVWDSLATEMTLRAKLGSGLVLSCTMYYLYQVLYS